MHNSLLLATTIGFSWLLCTESLLIFGSASGHSGWLTFASLFGMALLYLHGRTVVSHACGQNGETSPFQITRKSLGVIPAMTLLIGSRLSMALLLPMVVLVTAGFAFNEIFLYWFPNFGFAFLLLGLVLILHLLGERVTSTMQVVFCCSAISAVVLLIILGLAETATNRENSLPIHELHSSLSLQHTFSFLFLFLGFESIFFKKQKSRSPYVEILVAVIILGLWGLVGLLFTPQAKLLNSTVPYLTAARYMLEDEGRFLMGITIIASSLGVTSGFFLMARRELLELVSHSRLTDRTLAQARIALSLFLAITVGGLMAAGIAGSEHLTSYILGTLLLWLFGQKVELLAALAMTGKKLKQKTTSYFLAALWPLAIFWLAFSAEDTFILGCYLLSVLLLSLSLSCLWYWLGRYTTNPDKRDKNL